MSSSDEENIGLVRRKPRQKLLLEDDDDEGNFEKADPEQNPDHEKEEGDEEVPNGSPEKKRKSRIIRDLDSDEEHEELNEHKVRILDSDVSDDEKVSDKSEDDNKLIGQTSVKKSVLDLDVYDAEGSSDEERDSPSLKKDGGSPNNLKTESNKKLYLNSDIYDAEGSSDDGGISLTDREPAQDLGAEGDGEEQSKSAKGKKSKEKKKSNKNKKGAKNELDEIHAESQRLVRCSRVSLPYHTPKQRTLDDFLNRRKSNPPVVPLRSSADHIKKVWEHIEKREIEAETFYKSESEDSNYEGNNGKGEKISENLTVVTKEVSFRLDDTSEEISAKEGAEKVVLNQDEMGAENNSSCPAENRDPEQSEGEQTSIPTKLTELEVDGRLSLSENDAETEFTVPENNLENITITDSEKDLNLSQEENSAAPEELPKTKDESQTPDDCLLDIRLNLKPKITATPDGVIDLEECSARPGGTIGLIQRFIKHTAIKPKPVRENVSLSITSAEYDADGEIIKLSEETVRVRSSKEPKPGERFSSLKAALQQAMAVTRQQQHAQKLQEYRLNEEEFYGDDPLEDVEEFPEFNKCSDKAKGEDDDDNGGDYQTEEEVEEEEEEDFEKLKISKIKKPKSDYSSKFIDNEAEVSEDEICSGDEDSNIVQDKDDSEDEEEVTKNGSEDEDNEKENESIQLSQDGSFNESFFNKSPRQEAQSLRGDNGDPGCTPGESQLMAMCSGKFGSQPLRLTDLEKDDGESEEMKLVFSEDTMTEDDIGKFNNLRKLTLESSEDEDGSGVERINKTKRKKKRKLHFSDDEDSSNDHGGGSGDESEKNEDLELENVDDKIDLEDEREEEPVEEEVEEEVNEGDNEDVAKFFDEEAELSGSEWGSADEDEQDLDILETEEADKEKINERKLRTELDRIHMKQILADDSKAIRILKEMYLEDGELDTGGQKRQRLYRWSNAQGDDIEKISASVFDSVENTKYAEEEEEEEASWRKSRLERETFLQKNKLKEANDDLDADLLTSVVRAKKPTPQTTPAAAKPQNELLLSSPDPKHPFKLLTKRGSFLGRSDRVLTRLAELTGDHQGDQLLARSKGKRNMVFAVISPPKKEEPETPRDENVLKRKSTDSPAVGLASKKLKFGNKCEASQCISILEKLRTLDFSIK